MPTHRIAVVVLLLLSLQCGAATANPEPAADTPDGQENADFSDDSGDSSETATEDGAEAGQDSATAPQPEPNAGTAEQSSEPASNGDPICLELNPRQQEVTIENPIPQVGGPVISQSVTYVDPEWNPDCDPIGFLLDLVPWP